MVATRARSGAMRYTAASSRAVPAPCSTLGSTIGGSAPSTCPSSTGLSLQAQPAPWLYSVNRSGESCSICCAKYRVCLIHAPARRLSPSTSPARRGGEVVPLVFAAIAPHGGIAVAEACAPDECEVAAVTRAGMEELGRLFAATRPEVVVVATPHNVHLSNALGVIVASRVAGKLDGVTPAVGLDLPSELELARSVLEAFVAAGVPAAGVSFGSNEPGTAVAPMDWGVLIPLWFMGGGGNPPLPIVGVTPSRQLSAGDHVTAGAAIAAAASASPRRAAVLAPPHHGPPHLDSGPYGYHPSAARYDTLVCDPVQTQPPGGLVGI